MSNYLLDTNIISYLTDPNSVYREKVKAKLLSLSAKDSVSVSIITLYELAYGLHSYKNGNDKGIFQKGIQFITEYLNIMPLDVEEIDIFGKLKASYKTATGITTKDNKKNDLDFLIIATAINHDVILVSNDVKILDKLSKIEPKLQYENWISN